MPDQSKSKLQRLKQEAREKTVGYIVAALGLVAGLAWNEAVKSLIDYLFPIHQNGIVPKFIYAVVVTVVVIIVSVIALSQQSDSEK